MLPFVLAAVGGYLVYDSMKSEKFAKGGGVSQNTPMGIAKMLYNKYDKKERKEFLISAGYSDSVSNDLSMESWDSLEKQVHTNLAKVLQSGKRKTYGTFEDGGMMADGGEVDKLRNDIIKLEDYISKLKDVEKYEKEDEEKVITNKETRIFFENKLEKLKKRLEELESDGGKMAKGGITTSEITDFKEYVKDNYAKGGTWSEFFPPNGATRKEIDKAVNMYVYWCRTQKDQWGGGDTFDREIVRDIMLANRGQSRNFEYPKQVNAVLKFNAQLDAAKMRKK